MSTSGEVGDLVQRLSLFVRWRPDALSNLLYKDLQAAKQFACRAFQRPTGIHTMILSVIPATTPRSCV